MFKYGIYPKYKVQGFNLIPYENPPLIGVAENEQSLREELRFCTIMQYVELLYKNNYNYEDKLWAIINAHCIVNNAILQNFKQNYKIDEFFGCEGIYRIGITFNIEKDNEYADLLNNIKPETLCEVVEINATEAYLICEKALSFNDWYYSTFEESLKRSIIFLSLNEARAFQISSSLYSLELITEDINLESDYYLLDDLDFSLSAFKEQSIVSDDDYPQFVELVSKYLISPSPELGTQLMAYIKDYFYTITRI